MRALVTTYQMVNIVASICMFLDIFGLLSETIMISSATSWRLTVADFARISQDYGQQIVFEN